MSKALSAPEGWQPSAPNSLTPTSGLVIDSFVTARSAKIASAAEREREERDAQFIAVSVDAGQLAVGNYATPHTRQSAEIAAQIAHAGLVEGIIPLPPSINAEAVAALKGVAVMAASDELGQYFVPHARQSAEVAVITMLAQHGYVDQNQSRGEQ
jgi:hypothetical protein